MDFGSIMYNYVWLGFIKMMMFAYTLGGLQLVLGIIIGGLIVFFSKFIVKIVVILIILFVVGSIGVGIVASDTTWQDIKNGNWTGKVKNITQEQYQQGQGQVLNVTQQQAQITAQIAAQQAAQQIYYAQQEFLNNTWQNVGD